MDESFALGVTGGWLDGVSGMLIDELLPADGGVRREEADWSLQRQKDWRRGGIMMKRGGRWCHAAARLLAGDMVNGSGRGRVDDIGRWSA